MNTIMLSELGGGLNSVLLKRMNDSNLAVLTSYGIAEIVALPYALSKESAATIAQKYIDIDYDDESLLSARRLKSSVVPHLKRESVLTALRHNVPVAVLLPAATHKLAREQYAKLYLQALNYDDIQLSTLQSDTNGERC